MDRDVLGPAMRRKLAETHLRASVYKDQTLRLHRGGASVRDPRFMHAFMAAKAAHLELEARLNACARVEVMRQHALRVKIRVEEQEARRGFLAAHRRFLDPSLVERIDAEDDLLVEQEDRLEEVAEIADSRSSLDPSEGWMSPSDNDLLVMWQLSETPEVCRGDPSDPGSLLTYGPSAGAPSPSRPYSLDHAKARGTRRGSLADPPAMTGFASDPLEKSSDVPLPAGEGASELSPRRS
ncbi:tegument protein UL14 [Bovine alphaherpesvirus 2]|uniref:Tegument protein UL14 n=1 Tax=Bovine alphaherpesvirus 2 TaxID=10295 RepID=A0ABX6WLR6_9ALPH|nr:tegument protein UL14 [Bovine alphaherpesvirus 2]QPO25147.1 tegument protein UL14 [Bovine alphaherpesvirus 2]